MSYYNDNSCWGTPVTSTCGNSCGNGWGVGLSAIIGGALGYWAGRSSTGPFNAPFGGYGAYAAPAAVQTFGYATNQCRSCFQEGVESGQTLAGLDYIGKQVASNNGDIKSALLALTNQMNNQSAAIQARFDALAQQKIADQAAQIAALRTQNVIGLNAAATNMQLTSINDKISSIVTNCGVRAYPGCPQSCGCNTNV